MMRKLSLLLVIAMAVIACGSPDEEIPTTAPFPTSMSPSSPTTSTVDQSTTAPGVAEDFPVSVAGADIAERPVAIVSLSPTATEVLFAIGAGPRVIAVDSLSDYPVEAPTSDLSAFEPNVEAIAGLEPDLVIISWDPGGLVEGLEALGIPVVNHPGAGSFDDAYQQISELGDATGNQNGATQLIITMQVDIAALVEASPRPEVALTYYHEVDDALYSATSATFVGSIYGLFGLDSIADAADPDGWGFPQLSAEYIIESDPDLIFYGCALWCGTTPDTIAARPGWSGLTAINRGTLTELDDDIASRWGPRLVDFVQLIGEALWDVDV